MAKYLETAEDLRKAVNAFLETHCENDGQGISPGAGVELGHIVNLAVLTVECNPRQSQGVVRENIVATAMKNHCKVTMTKVMDEKTKREYNRINIVAKEGRT